MLDHSLPLTDLYQLSMLEVYGRYDMDHTAVFELFVRKLPMRRAFLRMAELEQLVQFLERMHYSWSGCVASTAARMVLAAPGRG